MKFDLHTHSTASDGTLSPLHMWQSAVDQELNYFALTDHDTIDGYLQLLEEPSTQGHAMPLISGVEISSSYFSNTLHIVALNVDVKNPALLTLLAGLQEQREHRAKAMSEKLESILKIEDLYTQVLENSDCEAWQLGRPHIARYLVEQELASNENQVFKRWLGQGKKAYVQTQWPDYKDVIEVIKQAGGVAVLAHPLKYGMTRTKVKAMIGAFAQAGGQAIEVAYLQQKDHDTKYLARLCDQFDLYASGGSDYHGPHMSWAAVGKVPDLPETCQPVWNIFS